MFYFANHKALGSEDAYDRVLDREHCAVGKPLTQWRKHQPHLKAVQRILTYQSQTWGGRSLEIELLNRISPYSTSSLKVLEISCSLSTVSSLNTLCCTSLI